MRRLIAIFLLMLLPLHSFAMQGGALNLENAYNIDHELEHLERVSHHHDDDGSVHYDQSDESVQHISEHSACQHACALPSTGVQPFMVMLMATVPVESASDIPDLFLERPQRPPSLSLG
jgi:hypothetical protein